jgi:hypothetical protein
VHFTGHPQRLDKPAKICNCNEVGLQPIYNLSPPQSNLIAWKEECCESSNCEKGGVTVSFMACVSAIGWYFPPFIVMKGQRYNDNYDIDMPPGTEVVIWESGCLMREEFSQFLDHFT